MGKQTLWTNTYWPRKPWRKPRGPVPLLEDATFHDRALALGFKADALKDLGHITEALAIFRDARELFALAEQRLQA